MLKSYKDPIAIYLLEGPDMWAPPVSDHNCYAIEVTKERLFTAKEKAQTKECQFNMAR